MRQQVKPGRSRRARERRVLVFINLGLLVVAGLIAAPRTVRAVVLGVREGRECAAVRSTFATNDVRAIESGADVDVDDSAYDALSRLSNALRRTPFEVLDVHVMLDTIGQLLEIRQKLAATDAKVNEQKVASERYERFAHDEMPQIADRLTRLSRVCAKVPAAKKDCLAISKLGMPTGGDSTTEALRRRLVELEAFHRAKAATPITHREVKAIVVEDLAHEQQFIDLTREYLRKTDAVDGSPDDPRDLRRTERAKLRALRQQMAGIRLYCDATVDAKAEVRR